MSALSQFIQSRWFYPLSFLLVVIVTPFTLTQMLNLGIDAIDSTTHETMNQRVEASMHLETRRLNELLTEYTYWDDAYINLVEKPDKAWADGTIGAYMHDNLSIAISFVIFKDNKTGMVFSRGQLSTLPFSIDTFQYLIDRTRQQYKRPDPQNLFIKTSDDIYLIALDSFIPETENSSKSNGAVLGIGRSISAEYIEQIGELHLISGLKLLALDHQHEETLSRTFVDNNLLPVFDLGWDNPSPSASIKTRFWKLVIIGSVLLISMFTLIFLLLDKRYKSVKNCSLWLSCRYKSKPDYV